MAKFLDLTGLGQFLTKVKTWATSQFVTKESGKGLSTNDYTTTEKQKLAGLTPTKIDIVKLNGSPLSPDGSKAINIDLSTYALKSAVTQEIAQAVSGIKQFEGQVVESLPETGKAGILYLVPNNGSGQNVYDEYLWINGKYEKLATKEIDLSSYAKKTEIPTKTSQLANDSGYLTAVPGEYVTDEELVGKGYQTSEQVQSAITGAAPTAITAGEIDALFKA